MTDDLKLIHLPNSLAPSSQAQGLQRYITSAGSQIKYFCTCTHYFEYSTCSVIKVTRWCACWHFSVVDKVSLGGGACCTML